MVNNIIEKSNILNTMKMLSEPNEQIGLIEFRFFCLYLSKINARNPEKRTVKVKIEDFKQIFGVSFHSSLFTKQLKKIATRQMRVVENGKYIIINLYSKFAWSVDNPKELEITCNYDVMPYLFELQKNYTSYKIMNIVKLNSVQKIRLYEIMKQYEKIGRIKFDIIDLQEMLCSKIQEFRFFKRDTLEPAIKDVNEYTDIQVSYEKNLLSRKVVALTFTISKKKDFIDIDDEIPVQIEEYQEKSVKKKEVELHSTFNNDYLPEQLENLLDIAKSVSNNPEAYLKSIYYQIKARNKKISNMYNYTLSIINADLKKIQVSKKTSILLDDKPSYDLEQYEKTLYESYFGTITELKTQEEVAEECHNKPTQTLILDLKQCTNYNDVCEYTNQLSNKMSNEHNCCSDILFRKDFTAYCNKIYEVYNVKISIINIEGLEKNISYIDDFETLAVKSVIRYFYKNQ